MTLETYKAIYAKAQFIRAFELEIAAQADAGTVPGLVHLSLGAELFEAALAWYLDGRTDQVTGSHRSHGLILAMKADPVAVAAEILGREAGLSKGLGGTQHLMAPEVGFLTSNGIVGGQVPLAAGAALSAKTLHTGGIAVAVFGDGAANQGGVFETMNLAAALRLPLLFVIENNGFGQSTGAKYAAGGVNLQARARGFNMAAAETDGSNLSDMCRTLDRMTDFVRETGNPALIEAHIPRLGGHYHGENQVYRAAGDGPADPLVAAQAYLLHAGLTVEELDTVAANAAGRARKAIAAALNSPDGSADALASWPGRLGGAA